MVPRQRGDTLMLALWQSTLWTPRRLFGFGGGAKDAISKRIDFAKPWERFVGGNVWWHFQRKQKSGALYTTWPHLSLIFQRLLHPKYGRDFQTISFNSVLSYHSDSIVDPCAYKNLFGQEFPCSSLIPKMNGQRVKTSHTKVWTWVM